MTVLISERKAARLAFLRISDLRYFQMTSEHPLPIATASGKSIFYFLHDIEDTFNLPRQRSFRFECPEAPRA